MAKAKAEKSIEILEYPHPMAEIVQGRKIIVVKTLREARLIRNSMRELVKAFRKSKTK